ILACSTLLLVLAMLESLRLVQRTRRALPWVLLSIALGLMILRRLAAPFSADGREPSLFQELVALVISAFVLLAVRGIGRVNHELSHTRRARALTEESYRALVANLPMIALVLDAEGNLTILNPLLAVSLTGYTPQEIATPFDWRRLVHDEDLPGVEAT